MCLLEDKNYSGHPSGKNGPKELLLNTPCGFNQFQVPRDLLESYPSSDSSCFGGASRIPESTFDDVVAIQFALCY